MDGSIWVNLGIFIGTAGGAAVAWWQAVAADRARDDARTSERAALAAQAAATVALEQANTISGQSLRAPYARALSETASLILQARISGSDPVKAWVLGSGPLREHAFDFGDAPHSNITEWCRYFPLKADIGVTSTPGFLDFQAAMSTGELIDERIRLWMRDPIAAEELIAKDPRY